VSLLGFTFFPQAFGEGPEDIIQTIWDTLEDIQRVITEKSSEVFSAVWDAVDNVSQLPTAFAEESGDIFSAIWDAIDDLQTKDNDLQSQIDELRESTNALLTQQNVAGPLSEPSIRIEMERTDVQGQILFHITALNNGPDMAAGVKLTAFYKMQLLKINSITGTQCEKLTRGIIECHLGTLENGQESTVTIDATATEFNQLATITADVSSTTEDSDPTNNHQSVDFMTGSGERVEVTLPAEPDAAEQEISEQDDKEEQISDNEADGENQESGNASEESDQSEGDSGVEETESDTSEDENQTAEQEEQTSAGEQESDEGSESSGEESGDSSEGSEDGKNDDSSSESTEQQG
jgi:hypothetical protein